MTLLIIFFSCNHGKDNQQQIENEKNETISNRPSIKDYILDSKRPDIIKECQLGNLYQVKKISVGGLSGQLDVHLNADTLVEKIEFNCNDLRRNINYDEFLKLVRIKYKLNSMDSLKIGAFPVDNEKFKFSSGTINWFNDSTYFSLYYNEYDDYASVGSIEKWWRKRNLLKVAKQHGYGSSEYKSLSENYIQSTLRKMSILRFSISSSNLQFNDAIKNKTEYRKANKDWQEKRNIEKQKRLENLLNDF